MTVRLTWTKTHEDCLKYDLSDTSKARQAPNHLSIEV